MQKLCPVQWIEWLHKAQAIGYLGSWSHLYAMLIIYQSHLVEAAANDVTTVFQLSQDVIQIHTLAVSTLPYTSLDVEN